MKEILNYEKLIEVINNEKLFLLYISSPTCGVCKADFPKIKKIAEKENIKSYKIDITKVKKAAGQLLLFSVPAVLLFYETKEIHRQSRIIDFEELKFRIKQSKLM
ncbi:thioredoxin family protein [Leptotrichia sp. oral taxon 847]|uniref:thioredoxin family protein n=1 Tax=Leptotrichia sp. oral taxon 847 TaxID=1785996 RepID=UPI0007683E4E|nr:thioredoxin family protein [Leptotrichia sp. oral taxon 847]AMD95179.1 thioredoxin [Leptotrichia sp. oral taxon 847]